MFTLNDGRTLPAIGFGTYQLQGEDGTGAIVSALEAGYRLLDTAVNYQNHAEVGEALRRSGLPREDVWVTTKIPGCAHERAKAVEAVERSLEELGVDRVDLVLVHWPNPSQGRYVEAFEALVECRERGLTGSVGVSNFTEQHLDDVITATGVAPVVNQIEVHPLFPQGQMVRANADRQVLTQSWSPLGKRQAQYHSPAVTGPAERLGATPAQVILAWHLARGLMPIPKSGTPQRQVDNLAADRLELLEEEVEAITALGRPDGRLFGGDPTTHEEL